MKIAMKGLALSMLMLVQPVATANGLGNAQYEVLTGQFNNDNITDILLRSKDTLVMIALDDLSIPIPIKSKFQATVIVSFPDGSYAIDTSAQVAAINQTAWVAEGFELQEADFNADNKSELFLRATRPGMPSFILASNTGQGSPFIKQLLTPSQFGLDFGVEGTTIDLRDENNDNRMDIVVKQNDIVAAVLIANEDGTFSALGDKQDDSDRTIAILWGGFCRALEATDVQKSSNYFSVATRDHYKNILSQLGDSIGVMTANWGTATPIIIEKDHAEYAITQTYQNKTRMHLIGFSRGENGQWLIENL
ncbi:MAG: hypothetical protein V3W04_12730 [Gammaproteobacteria bacterium]